MKYIDLVKVVKVIKSCKNIEQLTTAEKYYKLFLKKYNNNISKEYIQAIEKLLTLPYLR